jgi:hypothetical protein
MPVAEEHDGETTTEGLPAETYAGNFHDREPDDAE